MTYATTFTGIGGWELGLDACGWELRWQCEADTKLQRFLVDRFGVPVYPDVRSLADQRPEAVVALIGSPPCQPFSVAGAQRGVADERHLFPAFLDAVRVLRPRWVLMEQVPAILSLDDGQAFGVYVGPLAALGYDLVWHCIPACAVGAPHRRDRIWIVAHAVCGRKSLERNVARNRRIVQPAPAIADWSRKDQPQTLGVAHGVPHRVDRLKGLGNAVFPEIHYIIGQAINAVEGEDSI